MQRDLNLIRQMLIAIENAPSGWAPELNFDGYSNDQINYHAYLLIDAGLARGHDITTLTSDGPEGAITHLTWEGHEFAAAARNESRWNKAMGVVAEEGGNITLDVMKQLLVSFMKASIGLP